jgi:hypothetical protein
VVHYRHLFGWIRTRSETLFLRPKFGPWQHCSCAWIKIAASFPSPDDGKITKGLAHCVERPAPYVIADEKCAIFSNSVVLHFQQGVRLRFVASLQKVGKMANKILLAQWPPSHWSQHFGSFTILGPKIVSPTIYINAHQTTHMYINLLFPKYKLTLVIFY